MSSNYVYGISRKARKVLVYDPSTNPRQCWNGKEHLTFTSIEVREMYTKKSNKSKYIPIEKEDGKTLEDTYDSFVELAEKVLQETEGKINLYKTGTSSKVSLKLFFDEMTNRMIEADPIDEKEGIFLHNTNQGAIIYSDKDGYTGKGYSYDVNSLYPSIMKSVNFRVPIKKGTFRKLTKTEFENMLNTFFQYGIYRVQIDVSSYHKYPKLFRVNKNNYYTSIDLNVAKGMGLRMEIIEDGEDNFLHYGADSSMTGSQLFKNYVDYLSNLRKTTGDKIYKLFLNQLWGGLCQFNKVPKPILYDVTKPFDYGETFSNNENVMIIKQGFTTWPKWKIEYMYKSRLYRYSWARLKPFMLAKGRETIGRIMKPHLQHIHRIHTDGFVSSKELDIETGTDIGKLRYEGYKRMVTIAHSNQVLDWEDKDDFAKVLKYYQKKKK